MKYLLRFKRGTFLFSKFFAFSKPLKLLSCKQKTNVIRYASTSYTVSSNKYI